jgi:hypothetical protein
MIREFALATSFYCLHKFSLILRTIKLYEIQYKELMSVLIYPKYTLNLSIKLIIPLL